MWMEYTIQDVRMDPDIENAEYFCPLYYVLIITISYEVILIGDKVLA